MNDRLLTLIKTGRKTEDHAETSLHRHPRPHRKGRDRALRREGRGRNQRCAISPARSISPRVPCIAISSARTSWSGPPSSGTTSSSPAGCDAARRGRDHREARLAAMIRGFCHAHDEDPTLFRFLLFVQHGQLSKLAAGTPNAGRRRAHRARTRAITSARDSRRSTRTWRRRSSSGSCCSRSRLPPTAGCRPAMSAMSDRLVAAAWAAVRLLPGDLSCDRHLSSS